MDMVIQCVRARTRRPPQPEAQPGPQPEPQPEPQLEPRRSRPTRVRRKKARFSFDANQIRSYDERLSKAKTNKKEKSAPMKDITNKLSDDLDANVRQMLSAHGDEKVPSVVTQGRAIFNADDPSKYSEKRKNEIVEVVGHGMDMMAKGILPNVPTPMRRQIMATALAKRNVKDQKELSKKAKKSKKPDEPELHHAQYGERSPNYAGYDAHHEFVLLPLN